MKIHNSILASHPITDLIRSGFLVFVLSFVISGCKKNEVMSYHTIVKGTILENGTGKRIEGATVLLAEGNSGSFISYSYHTIASKTSDGNGNYSFDFTASPNSTYVIVARKSPYFESDQRSPNVGQTNIINITLNPPSYIKFHVKNIHSNYLIDIYGSSAYSKDFYGSNIDTIFVSYKLPVGIQPIYWDVWDVNNNKSHFSGQVTTTPFDTIPFSINY